MSKGRVWNKGKRNGGAGPPADKVSHVKKKVGAGLRQEGVQVAVDKTATIDSPLNRVGKMNRTNWVERPKRVKRDQPVK
ncbi:hypothetical protein NV379_18865 [Paenibacillus sp. N1-5-1-14]|uniref:hypothetical protein n=1 Tax=Paenibacillus radicibacter TaxID=2972488 RepID=UPI002159909F|nr:hypothetical protein [Paenibacillus radicibacter]MCR8644720.1 hypothetical protein [Paenibacillus radicibacter]